MNTFEKQEERSRRQISWSAVLKVGLAMGLYLFIFAGGTPWTGAGVASGVLGRAYGLPVVVTGLAHFGLCLAYVALIAAVTYRLHVWIAVLVGPLVTLALYGLTFPLLATHNVGDSRAFSAHLVLGLFGTALYKALSVPKISATGPTPQPRI